MAKDKRLSVDDLGNLRKSDKIQAKLDLMKKNYKEQKKKNLILAILKTFKWEYTMAYMIGGFGQIIDIFAPILVQKII